MKLDKETMIKQRFWFLLPVFAICILVGWICVLGVRGETETNYKKALDKDKALKGVTNEPELKNGSWIDAMAKEFEVSSAKKNELWYKEFDRQNSVIRDPKDRTKYQVNDPFIKWPEKTRTRWMAINQGRDTYQVDFGEFLGNIPSDEYREEYRSQYEPIVDLIRDWLDESNASNLVGGVRVIGANGNHRNFVIPQLLMPAQLNKDKHITSDEIFLLQEDIAVKRELFNSLSDLLLSYSKLKTEWEDVPYTEIKETPAPAAAPPAGDQANAAAASAATTAPETNTRKEPEPQVFQRHRFYNYVWPNLLSAQEVSQDARLKSSVVELGIPNVETNKGWRLDLSVVTDPQDDKKLVLQVLSANHSNQFTLPVMPLSIWYSALDTGLEVPTPLNVTDAGGVGPCEYWPNGSIKKLSVKKLKDISLPANFGKVTRVSRVLPENTIDQQIAFNSEWLVQLQLMRRPNSPTLTMKGDIINRSGRRLPVATFTAGFNLPNDTKLLNEDFKVPTDAFNAGERRGFTQEIKNPIPPRSISIVKQKLNWRSSPIKRIDRIVLGHHAHVHSDRLKVLPLKPYDFKVKDVLNQNPSSKVPAEAATTGADSGLGGTSGRNKSNGTEGLGTMGGSGGGGSSGGGASEGPASENQNIPLNRYVEVTPQLRRMPVALVMVVDATAITDVIGAMSNSRLRFQVTMAPWTKVPNLGRPGGTITPSTPSGGNPTSRGGGSGSTGGVGNIGGVGTVGGAGVGGGGAGGSKGVPPPPGGGSTGQNRPASGPANLGLEDDSSVVELQIYGIVTIYESPDQAERLAKLKANPPATPASTTPGK
jgi:uncharacterized membrane protein YgcG